MVNDKHAPSESRRHRAAQTRARMLDAAYRLFCEKGWEGTTMQLVAQEAGVAVQTVYFTFGTKAALLSAVEVRTLLGGSTVDNWFNEWHGRVEADRDPCAVIRLFVDTDTEIKRRLAPLVAALGTALPSAPRTPEDRESGRDRFFAGLVTRLQILDALRDGITPARALDIVRALADLRTFTDLTMRRGWSEDEWRAWLTELLTGQLLRQRD